MMKKGTLIFISIFVSLGFVPISHKKDDTRQFIHFNNIEKFSKQPERQTNTYQLFQKQEPPTDLTKFWKNLGVPENIRSTLDLDMINNFYKKFVNHKEGVLTEYDKRYIGSYEIESYSQDFYNSTNDSVIIATPEKAKSIKVSTNWSITSQIGTKFDFNLKLASSEFNVSSTNLTGGATSESDIFKLPSMNIRVLPNSHATFSYSVVKETYQMYGQLRFPLNLNDKINLTTVTKESFLHSDTVIYNTDMQEIYNTYCKSKSREYCGYLNHKNPLSYKSYFTVDDIENPLMGYFNLPFTWTSEKPKFIYNWS